MEEGATVMIMIGCDFHPGLDAGCGDRLAAAALAQSRIWSWAGGSSVTTQTRSHHASLAEP